jgi:hypothetical protein
METVTTQQVEVFNIFQSPTFRNRYHVMVNTRQDLGNADFVATYDHKRMEEYGLLDLLGTEYGAKIELDVVRNEQGKVIRVQRSRANN